MLAGLLSLGGTNAYKKEIVVAVLMLGAGGVESGFVFSPTKGAVSLG
jgi:hypothetical protein